MMHYPFQKKTLVIPIFLLLALWSIFFIEVNGFGLQNCYGVIPRTFTGLKGILLSPLFHSGWRHIISNSFPLLFLSFLAFLLYDRLAYYVLFFGWIISGSILWLIGNPPFLDDYVGCHIGASSIVYMLAAFLFFSGLFRKEKGLMAVSLIIIFMYGSMIWGMIPENFLPQLIGSETNNPISWEGHFSGFITGLFFAYLFRRLGPQKKKAPWEQPNYYDPREEELWQRYLDSQTSQPYEIEAEEVSSVVVDEHHSESNDNNKSSSST